MKIIMIISSVLIILGCSGKPTTERFENIINRHIGTHIEQTGGKGEYYKIEERNNSRFYYSKNYSYRNKGECIFVFITDLNDIILKYEVLTPETCKAGIPISG